MNEKQIGILSKSHVGGIREMSNVLAWMLVTLVLDTLGFDFGSRISIVWFIALAVALASDISELVRRPQ